MRVEGAEVVVLDRGKRSGDADLGNQIAGPRGAWRGKLEAWLAANRRV